MIAPMGLMAGQTVLCHRSMLPGKGSSFLRMALETELVYGVGSYHFVRAGRRPGTERTHRFGAEATHGVVATGAGQLLMGHQFLVYGVARLFIRLCPDVPVTAKA